MSQKEAFDESKRPKFPETTQKVPKAKPNKKPAKSEIEQRTSSKKAQKQT